MTGSTVLFYDILDKIGEGGMGAVYRARDRRLDRLVAIKFLPTEAATDTDRRRRFLDEARAASALNHPGIVTIYDVGEDASSSAIYIAMELVAGETLATTLQSARPSAADAIRIAIQIADAIGAAHNAGVIHRDLKPANIMLFAGRIKVLDFGLARRALNEADELTRTAPGTIMGTAAYMSPEQIEGREVDPRSDVFALGLILYEMLSGRRAFSKPSPMATMAAVLHERPEPLQADDMLREIVDRCLARRVEDRFPRMADLQTALERYQSNTSATTSTTWKFRQTSPKETRLAVLPFADMSPQKDQEYFCDGIAEEILGALSQLPCVFVASRTSSFRFKGGAEDIRSIGAALNVDAILEGSVRKSGDRLRITAQLVNVADGYRVWSERWDRLLADIFDVQDEIAHAVVSALQLQFLPGAACAIVRRPTNDPEAYSLYLHGRHSLNTWSLEGLEGAIDYFQKALARDPDYAGAWSGLADVYTVLGGFGHRAPREYMPKAVDAARKAIALDDSLAEAHCSLAIALVFSAWNWQEAELHFHRALSSRRAPEPSCTPGPLATSPPTAASLRLATSSDSRSPPTRSPYPSRSPHAPSRPSPAIRKPPCATPMTPCALAPKTTRHTSMRTRRSPYAATTMAPSANSPKRYASSPTTRASPPSSASATPWPDVPNRRSSASRSLSKLPPRATCSRSTTPSSCLDSTVSTTRFPTSRRPLRNTKAGASTSPSNSSSLASANTRAIPNSTGGSSVPHNDATCLVGQTLSSARRTWWGRRCRLPGTGLLPGAILLLTVHAAAHAQFASYDRLMADLMERYQLPGGTVAVSHNGKLVFSKGYGVPAEALFRIASVSKPFTAVAILKLVEQGKLRLDDKAFPEPARDPRLNTITIRQILHHTAGWDRDASFDPMFRGLGAPDAVIRYMLTQKLDFDPGTKFAYSNFGFCVLGRIIERASGLSYEEFVKREVLSPSGITRMKIGRSAASDEAAGEVRYYRRGPMSPYGGFNLEAMDSHGGWIASAPDLLKFVNAIDGRSGKPLLTKASIAELTSRPAEPLPQDTASWYGLGFNIRPAGRDANWWHSGSLPGTTTLLVRTHHGYAWAALFNARPAGDNKLAQELDTGLWKAFNEVNWRVQQ